MAKRDNKKHLVDELIETCDRLEKYLKKCKPMYLYNEKMFHHEKGFEAFKHWIYYSGKIMAYLYVLDRIGEKTYVKSVYNKLGAEKFLYNKVVLKAGRFDLIKALWKIFYYGFYDEREDFDKIFDKVIRKWKRKKYGLVVVNKKTPKKRKK